MVKVMGKGKPLMYDQCVSVTKEQLRYNAELEAQEKMPVYDYGRNDAFAGDLPEVDKEQVAEMTGENLTVNYLSKEEVQKIFNNERFKKFIENSDVQLDMAFEKKVPLIEDILEHECPDLAEDIRQKLSDPDVLSDATVSSTTNGGFPVNTKGYMVSQISFTDEKVLVAAYALIDNKSENPKGQVIVWNLENSEAVYVGIAKAKVNRIFCPAESEGTIIWGGLANGQIVKWDINSGKQDPIVRTKPSLAGHCLPIYGLFTYDLGTANSYGILLCY